MPYPEELVTPMRQELVEIGFQELKTADDVDNFLDNGQGSAVLVFNSVCGCAAGGARPGIAQSLNDETKPDRLATVFAGQDLEATQRLRERFSELPPSSPSAIVIDGDGNLVDYIARHRIEGHTPGQIAQSLTEAYGQLNKADAA